MTGDSLSSAATVAHFHYAQTCNSSYTDQGQKGITSTFPLIGFGVAAFSGTSFPCLICNTSPSTTALCCICIVLPLHCLCKSGPRFTPRLFFLLPLPFLYLLLFPPGHPSLLCQAGVTLQGLGGGRTWLSSSAAALVLVVKVAVCSAWDLAWSMQ